jgi:shikimate kinase
MKIEDGAIILIGFMGAGKSSVGRTLARITGRPRFDTDEIVAGRFGLNVAEIFEKHGEDSFRESETEALRDLSGKKSAIIVTGGGIVIRPENVALLKTLGTIVYLSADEETLFHRISRRTTRPLLKTPDPRRTLTELLSARLPLYQNCADVEVDTSKLSHEEVARRVLESIET